MTNTKRETRPLNELAQPEWAGWTEITWRYRRTLGKRKRPPSRHRSGSLFFVLALEESHFRESLSSVLAPFWRAAFLCLDEARICNRTPQRRPLGADR